MWDIDAIIAQHNQYALEEMMTTLRVQVVQSPQPKNWSLSVLAEKLRTGPPLISALLESFTSVEVLSGFLELIMRYLPEHEVEILSEKGNARVYRFGEIFGRRYFSFPVNFQYESIHKFITGLPIRLLGMSYSAYHDLAMRPGYILMLSLLNYPYTGDSRDDRDDAVPFDPRSLRPHLGDDYKPAAGDIEWLRGLVGQLAIGGQWVAPAGFMVVKTGPNVIELNAAANTAEVKELIRRTILVAERAGIQAKFKRVGRTAEEKLHGAKVALLDATRRIVGDNLTRQIVPAGWSRAHVHRMTDGTVYSGLGDFADWVFGRTSCVLLDYSYENCMYSEGDTEPTFQWSKHNIDLLTKQNPRVRQIRENIDNLVEYIEGDPTDRFGDLVELLNSKKETKKPVETARIVEDDFMSGIPLDQVDSKEEDDDE